MVVLILFGGEGVCLGSLSVHLEVAAEPLAPLGLQMDLVILNSSPSSFTAHPLPSRR